MSAALATQEPAVRERPILFSAPMVRAILEGRKTQTRRIACSARGELLRFNDRVAVFGDSIPDDPVPVERRNRYGAPGERLWVKETFQIESNRGIDDSTAYPPRFNDGRPVRWHDGVAEGRWWQQPHYRATEAEHDLVDYEEEDDDGNDKPLGWKPSIFMPRWASRIDLEITGVRVERLQDISEDDAHAEGVPDIRESASCARLRFSFPWDTINGERASWAANPWVWVIEFKRVRP